LVRFQLTDELPDKNRNRISKTLAAACALAFPDFHPAAIQNESDTQP
jgi:hypothetical protein